jgi:hypothetical protein
MVRGGSNSRHRPHLHSLEKDCTPARAALNW